MCEKKQEVNDYYLYMYGCPTYAVKNRAEGKKNVDFDLLAQEPMHGTRYGIYGEPFGSIREMCKAYSTTPQTYYKRRKKGWTHYESLNGERSFKEASIASPRVGETIYFNRYKQTGEIIRYRSEKDIDIRLEDGSVVMSRNYYDFLQEKIFFPYYYVGQTFPLNNGIDCMVLFYRNKRDCDIMFLNDFTIKRHADFKEVKRGCVSHPKLTRMRNESLDEVTIRLHLNPYGFKKKERDEFPVKGLELDMYNDSLRVAIEYDGGGHNPKNDTKKDLACKKEGILLIRIRQKNLPPIEGGISTVFWINKVRPFSHELLSCFNKVTRYLSDRSIINIPYLDSFDIEAINTYIRQNWICGRLGEKKVMNCGVSATIINYRSYSDIDVQFETGEIRHHTSYGCFKKGNIRPKGAPNPKWEALALDRIGEERIMTCGISATIIAYRGADDIDVQFETGEIIRHRSYHGFKKGRINPRGVSGIPIKTERLGEKRVMNCGISATIIAYRGTDDIDVQFETGEISHHTIYKSFSQGCLRPKSVSRRQSIVIRQRRERLGETRTMNNGRQANIIEYENSMNITIQYLDDKSVFPNKTYGSFRRGTCGPREKNKGRS